MGRIMILGCNGGTDIALGGGAYVVAAISKCLGEHGYEVHLVSTIGAEREELVKIHGWELGSNVHTHYLIHYRSGVKLPYIVAVMALSRFRKLIRDLKPSLVIYNDDYPLSISREVRRDRTPEIAYIHFSYLVRRRLGFGFMHDTTEWSLLESMVNYPVINRLFGELHELDFIFTNSQGTKEVIANAGSTNGDSISVLYPPIKSLGIKNTEKERPVFLHAARQDKTYLSNDLLNFIVNMKKVLPDSVFIISRNKDSRLYRLPGSWGVFATPWLSNDDWRRVLGVTKYYLHFKWFEGLGIATIEAVFNGAVPIVYRSVFNGSWTDIARLCDRDCGFNTVDEAVDNVLRLESDYKRFRAVNSYLVNELSGRFSYDAFCSSLINVVKKYT